MVIAAIKKCNLVSLFRAGLSIQITSIKIMRIVAISFEIIDILYTLW